MTKTQILDEKQQKMLKGICKPSVVFFALNLSHWCKMPQSLQIQKKYRWWETDSEKHSFFTFLLFNYWALMAYSGPLSCWSRLIRTIVELQYEQGYHGRKSLVICATHLTGGLLL